MSSSPQPAFPFLERNRLPTLFEVLSRRALPPVDLFSFYIYMRDQQRSVEYLDFWMDVAQHMALCRQYVRQLRQSVLVDGPRSANDDSEDGKLSHLLRSEGPLVEILQPERQPASESPDRDSVDDGRPGAEPTSGQGNASPPARPPKRVMRRSAVAIAGPSSNATSAEATNPYALEANRLHGKGKDSNSSHLRGGGEDSSSTHSDANGRFNAAVTRGRGEDSRFGHTSDASDRDSLDHMIARQDIRASAEKILYTFLLPGAEREIILPGSIISDITSAIEESGRDDPEVFDVAKDYVFGAMERDAFPGFLQMKGLGNLIPVTLVVRLGFGLVSLFAGFWAAFVLIFLDASRQTRTWLILPFTLGTYMSASYQYSLDPVLAFLGLSEYTLFSFSRVQERYVRRLHILRATTVLAVVVVLDVGLLALFIFVPGKRL